MPIMDPALGISKDFFSWSVTPAIFFNAALVLARKVRLSLPAVPYTA